MVIKTAPSRGPLAAATAAVVLILVGCTGTPPGGAPATTFPPAAPTPIAPSPAPPASIAPTLAPWTVARVPWSGPPVPPDVEGSAWYQIEGRSDGTDSVVGQTLRVGQLGRPTWLIELPAASFAAGPFNGEVLVGADDEVTSQISLVSTDTGSARPLLDSEQVVWRATLDPAGESLYYVLLDRSSRQNLGVWRRSVVGGAAVLVLPPPPTDRITVFMAYELTWDQDETRLDAWSCGGGGCLSQILDISSSNVSLVDIEGLGTAIGLVGDKVISFAACEGPPCTVVAARPDGSSETLVPSATGAALVRIGSDDRLVYEDDSRRLTDLRLGTGNRTPLSVALPIGTSLLLPAAIAKAAIALPDGWAAAGPNGTLRSTSPQAPGLSLLRLSGGTIVNVGGLK